MELNDYNSTPETQEREPLPRMDFTAQPPVFTRNEAPNPGVMAQIERIANSAFGKGLAATIMAWFPIVSILAIIFGGVGLKRVGEANEMAQNYGVSAGGKNIAAKVLGLVGLISGIVMTVFWFIYIIAIVALVACW